MKPTVSQEKAINANGCDIIISAGAGSGKTATLTERIIRKIANGQDISRILAVTFMSASADELRTRITKALGEKMKENPKDKHVQEQIIKAVSADIMTVDSFCLKIVRANFDSLGIDANIRVADNGEVAILSKEAMAETIDFFYGEQTPDSDFITVCDCFSDFSTDDQLSEQLLTLYTKLSSTAKSIDILLENNVLKSDFMDTPYGEILKNHALSMLEYYEKVYSYMLVEIGKDENVKEKYLPPLFADNEFILRIKNVLKCGNYKKICDVFSEYSPLRMNPVRTTENTVDIEFVKALRKEFKKDINDVKEKYFSSDIEAIESAFVGNANICRAIYKILKKFEEEYSGKKRALSVCDFNDIERFALRVLYDKDGNVSEKAKKIADKYDEIYIDEYQDTNSLQDKIFRAVSKNNRFMVGDIKQSIYRFRSAEPEIFSYYREKFSKPDGNGTSVFMSENFRCDKCVIDYVNLVSDYTFGNTYGIPYSAKDDNLIFSKSVSDGYENRKTEICLVEETSEDEEESDVPSGEKPDEEAEYVALRIKDMLKNGTLPTGEKIKPKHIAILLRKYSTNYQKYISALKKHKIPYEYKGDEKFYEKSEILLLISILNSVDNPSKDVFLAGAMRSDIFGFSLEDLVKIRKSSKDTSLYDAVKNYCDEEELKDRISKFLEKLTLYRQNAQKMNSCEIISFILADTGFLSYCNESERKNVMKFYNMARQYEKNSYNGLYSFLRYTEKISKEETAGVFSSGDDECIKITSVHKSKGLEFEICFVCSNSDKIQIKQENAPIVYLRNLGVSTYVARENGIVKYDTLLRKCALLGIERHMKEEEMRILYVAMTRAKNQLILTAKTKSYAKEIEDAKKRLPFVCEYSLISAKKPIDWIIPPSCVPDDSFEIKMTSPKDIQSEEENESVSDSHESTEKEKIKSEIKKHLDFEYKYAYLEKIPSKLTISKLYPQILDSDENEEIDTDTSLDFIPSFISAESIKPTGAERGTATHVFMQFCDFEKLKNLGAKAELDRLTQEMFISKNQSELVNLNYIEKFRNSELFEKMLTSKKVIREFRFNVMLDAKEFSSDEKLKNEKILVQGVTDCIFEDDDGNLVLVDYKTDGVTLQNYEKELKERHTVQLSYYKKACALMFGKEPKKTLIYSVPLGLTVEI